MGLFARIPIAGRVRIAEIKGSLEDGIKVPIDAVLAKGSVHLSVKKDNAGKHSLWIDISVKIMFVKKITENKQILTLP